MFFSLQGVAELNAEVTECVCMFIHAEQILHSLAVITANVGDNGIPVGVSLFRT